ncbi:MAG: helix-turn-helix domain-containing protein [Spirochaetaceae bacterium]|jgi:transcriptional regulator with XRE-family HTH domain|nr:helix-turn-helix domain-containing protein [Spirochaetaceae bacterium]
MVEDSEKIGRRIIELRKALGLTQKQFAEGAKLSRTHIGSVESNQRTINDRIIRLICVAYGVNETWLRTGVGSMWQDVDDARLQGIYARFKDLDEYLQEYVLKQIDLYLEIQARQRADLAQAQGKTP